MKDSVTVCAGEREGGRASYSLAEETRESLAVAGHIKYVMQIDTHSYNKPTALTLVLEDTHGGHGHTLS